MSPPTYHIEVDIEGKSDGFGILNEVFRREARDILVSGPINSRRQISTYLGAWESIFLVEKASKFPTSLLLIQTTLCKDGMRRGNHSSECALLTVATELATDAYSIVGGTPCGTPGSMAVPDVHQQSSLPFFLSRIVGSLGFPYCAPSPES